MSDYKTLETALVLVKQSFTELHDTKIINKTIQRFIKNQIDDAKFYIDLLRRAYWRVQDDDFDEMDILHYNIDKDSCKKALSELEFMTKAVKNMIKREKVMIEEMNKFDIEPKLIENIINNVYYSYDDFLAEKEGIKSIETFDFEGYETEDGDDYDYDY